VFDEKLSTLERQWAADEERRQLGGAIFLGLTLRPEKSAAELAQAARLNAARALPDALFLADAQVQALHATYGARLAVSTNQGSIKRWLMAERERLAAQIDKAGKALAWAVLSDGANKDDAFVLARTELTALASDKALVQAIDAALALLALPPDTNQNIADEVDRARQALNERIFELKLSHIDGAKE